MTSPKRLALGGGAPVYIDDVFSTDLYTGNGSTQAINNGIDLAGKGGLVWVKYRGTAFHTLTDTVRGAGTGSAQANAKFLSTNSTAAPAGNATNNDYLSAFNNNGFSVTYGGTGNANQSAFNYVAWSFRRQEKFFDVVSYTGNGANRTISHNLNSVPGCIIVKRTDAASDWQVYHRSLANTEYMVLNSTAVKATGATRWNSTTPTSTEFSLGTDATVNANGGTYVAYLFAHDAGGFGATGTDNVISCGIYTGNGATAGPTITLGWEPQWILAKRVTITGTTNNDWCLTDVARGLPNDDITPYLIPNATSGEGNLTLFNVFPTGFRVGDNNSQVNANTSPYIYIAIRRSMRPPTSGTDVLGMVARTGTGVSTVVSSTLSPDMVIVKNRGTTSTGAVLAARLTSNLYWDTTATSSSNNNSSVFPTDPWGSNANAVRVGTGSTNDFTNASSRTYINYLFKRASGFMDFVQYTGTGVDNQSFNHNLVAAPKMIIIKARAAQNWIVYTTAVDGSNDFFNFNLTNAKADATAPAPTSTLFYTSNAITVNQLGTNYIAALFGEMPGISKISSYTGTGAAQTINCGFSNGARFVMIKRSDSTGNWYVWDTTRGIISGNDPYFLVNSSAPEVTNTDYLSVQSSGFGLTASAPADLNANGGTYLYMAIA